MLVPQPLGHVDGAGMNDGHTFGVRDAVALYDWSNRLQHVSRPFSKTDFGDVGEVCKTLKLACKHIKARLESHVVRCLRDESCDGVFVWWAVKVDFARNGVTIGVIRESLE